MTPFDGMPRARFISPLARAIAIGIAIASSTSCLVRFDGYTLENADAGTGGRGGTAGAAAETSRAPGVLPGGAGGTANAGGGNAKAAGSGGAAGSGSAGAMSTAGAMSSAGGNPNGAGTAGMPSGGNGESAGSGGGAKASAGTGGSGGGNLACPETHNRISVPIPVPGGSFYCIDRGEVKNVEYKAFLDAQVSTVGQASACAFNVSYEPDTANGCTQYDPIGKQNLPIACVDWCDAAAYCKWEGKHLCGKIGGGKNPPLAFADATGSAWYRACSHAGDYDLPYGNTYDGAKCIGLDNIAVRPVAVPNTNCEGGYSGLYDMSGNVSEWEDSCASESGGSDLCLYRGGSYLDTNRQIGGAPSLQCNSNVHGAALTAAKPRNTRDKEIGFRCCSEPTNLP